ncbi:MAG: lamin tail domain-containing protein, partial [Pseudoclavibacter sp.]
MLADGADAIVVNEAESSGGVPGDWVELFNTGDTDVDLSGWMVRDDNDTRESVIPDGTIIATGGYYIIEESALGFGLGGDDMARLFTPDNTLVSELDWAEHAATSFGKCPNGTGDGVVQTSVTKGAANDCGAPVRINEVESSGGTPGDWVELANIGQDPVDVSGFVVRDDDDDHTYVIPDGTEIEPAGYLVIDEADLDFGLGGSDSARLWDSDGTLIDEVSWSEHAATTLARCPDGIGEFAESAASTKGAPNSCDGDLEVGPWPGPSTVAIGDVAGTFDGDLSGLDYDEERDVLWAVVNGTGALWALTWDGEVWTPAEGWESGKQLRFADGAGIPDAEGVSVGPDGLVYVGVERDDDASGVSRNTVLQVDPDASGDELVASAEWALNDLIPETGANSGVEAVEWVPDAAVAGLVDDATGAAYDPATHAGALPGVFFAGVEATGHVTALALHPDGSADVIATIDPGMDGVMALDYDSVLGVLWMVCDEACDGLAAQLAIGEPDARITYVERPSDMPNVANEGFATAPQSWCVDGVRPVWYADDNNSDGNSIRIGALPCEAVTPPTTTEPVDPEPTDTAPGEATPGGTTPGAS